MPNAPVPAAQLKQMPDPWGRYVADHTASRDTIDAATTKLNARLMVEQDPTEKADLEVQINDLIVKRALVEQKFTAANAGLGQIMAPTATEVSAIVAHASSIAAMTAANMNVSAVIQTAAAVANNFVGLHI